MLPPVKGQLKKPRKVGRRAQQLPTNANPSLPVRWWRSRTFLVIVRILLLLAVLALTVFLYRVRAQAERFAVYGYPGIFLATLLANATVFLPAPGVAVVFAMGNIFHPLGVALAASLGGALGELSGYLAGFSGRAVIAEGRKYQRVTDWVRRYGHYAIFALAALPNPLFDIAGVAAGIVKMPLKRFLLFCWLGQLCKMLVFAYAGRYSLDWLLIEKGLMP